MKRTIAAVILLFACKSAFAVIGTAGGPAPYLKMGIGARGTALSGAFSAYYDDASCAFWNPASAALSEKISVASMVSLMTQDRTHSFIGAVFPFEWGALSAGLLNLSVENLEGRPDYDTPEYYLFSNSDNAALFSYSRRITQWLSAGAGIKVIFRNIDSVQAWGLSLDAGALIKPLENLSLAAVLSDFLNHQEWSTGRVEHILFAMKLSVLAELVEKQLKLSLEAEQLEASEFSLKAGVEAVLFRVFFLRAGSSYGFKSWYFDYTAGGGVRYAFGGVMLQADYGLVREEFYSTTDLNHKFSLSAYF